MLTKLALALSLLLSVAPSAGAAQPVGTTASPQDVSAHIDLLRTVQRAGTQVYVNHAVCVKEGNEGVNGMYYPGHNVLVICQDRATDTNMVEWTLNDLDTVRHETQHMIQDCVAGYHNERMTPFFNDKELASFANS